MSTPGNPEKTGWNLGIPLVLCIGLAIGLLVGSRMAGTGPREGRDKFREVLELIDENYVDEVGDGKVLDETIDFLLSKLDPHSAYIPASDREQANEDLRGNYEGIGVEFTIFRDTLTVVSALSGGPSEEVGIRSGDKIIRVDSQNIAGIGLKNDDVFKLLKGPRGSTVNITVLRRQEKQQYTITRDKIPQYSVDASYMINPSTGYIKVSRFSASTFDEFKEASDALREKGMKSLILDLQSNPGGYMGEAISMADEFLPDDMRIVYTKGKNPDFDQTANSTSSGAFEKGELIVLINEGTASAAEIVAGALQDNDRALLVGRRSFGKGLVQNPFSLKDGSELRLTISRYYTPSGRSIQKPYGDDQAYAEDLDKRFKTGELFHSDSVRFNDSLRFKTRSGRTVYGGGGIMPDYFVPLDTASGSVYLNELYYASAIQEYTLQYAGKNKNQLESIGMEQFVNNFQVNDEMLNTLLATGSRAGVEPDRFDLERNKKVFQVHIKAQIARKIWGNTAFYQAINALNEALQQAVPLIGQVNQLLARNAVTSNP